MALLQNRASRIIPLDANRMQWLEFYSQHRKYGYRVVMVTQGAKMVDNQFRMLVEEECSHRKLSNFGFLGWLLSRPFGGRVFLHVYTSFQLHERLYSEWHIARRRDMALYDSRARFDRGAGVAAAVALPS